MNDPAQALLLRITIGESDKWQGGVLYQALVEAAKRQGLAGATVLKGSEGYGAHDEIHTTHLLEFGSKLPVIVEIFDSEERIRGFIPTVEQMVQGGLVTLEQVTVHPLRPRTEQE